MRRETEGGSAPQDDMPGLTPELTQALNDLKGRLHLLFETARLTPLERLLCRRIYLGGVDPEEVADDLGISFEEARRLYRSALAKLRRQMQTLPGPIQTDIHDADLEQ